MTCFLIRCIETKFSRLLLAVFLFRTGFVWLNDWDLSGDESYYWDWSRRPDWCYFSKPPMVAWLIGATTWLLGDTTAIVRLTAVLLGSAFLAVFYLTAKTFYSRGAAAIAVLLLLATPANALGNLIMTIDPPVFLFWIATVYFLHVALFKADARAWWLAGIAAGLACLSKPVAILLPLSLALFLALNVQFRHQLRREFVWFLVPVLLSWAPIVYWNTQHDWVTFQHGQSHFAGAPLNFKQRIGSFAEFAGLQALLWSPPILVLALATCFSCGRRFFKLSAAEQLLFMMGPASLLGIFILATFQKVQGNWPTPFYFTALILLGGRLAGGIWRQWLRPAYVLGFVMVGIAYSLPVIAPALQKIDSRLDPSQRLRQWQTLALKIDAVRQKAFAKHGDGFLLVADHRFMASELAFYLPDHPDVFHVGEAHKVESQYEIWPGPRTYLGKDGLIVSKRSEQQIVRELDSAFDEIRLLETVSAPTGGTEPRQYHVYLGKHLQHWPVH